MDRGINPDPVMEHCGIALEVDQEYDLPIPIEKVSCLLETAAERTDNPCVGLTMGQDFHYESSSLLIVAMLAAPNVREGLAFLTKYDRFIDSGITISYSAERAPVEFGVSLMHPDASSMVQLNEYLLSFLVKTLGVATREPVPLLEVAFQHKNSPNIEPLTECFGHPVKFGADHNRIKFHPKYLDQRFLTANRLLFKVLSNAIQTYFSIGSDHNGFVDVVCRQIMMTDHQQRVSSESIAGRLNISTRTLRRKLADEGYSFQEAKNLAREQRAKYLLANTNASLTEIAYELGFSELSAFSRAFRRWVGETPQSYRESIRDLFNN